MGREVVVVKGCFRFFLSVSFVIAALNAGAATISERGQLIEKTGSVRYSQHSAPEVSAASGQKLEFGDKLRTLELSQATVRFADLTQWRMRELSTLEILPPSSTNSRPLLNLLKGALYFFSRGQPKELQIQTPHGTGGARGTEFEVQVEANRTLFVMYDGFVDLSDGLNSITLQAGEAGVLEPGQPPRKIAIEAVRIVQWWLYYPGVIDLEELGFPAGVPPDLNDSLQAYRAGDLQQALRALLFTRPVGSAAEQVYRAQLLLAAGEVARAEALLDAAGADSAPVRSLRALIAAVTLKSISTNTPPSASEQVALSYYYQSHFELARALAAARSAVERAPRFGFAWERVAELEFSYGRTAEADRALNRSLELAPRNAQAHALKGFVLAAQNRIAAAIDEFERAIELDGGLGNAWLGRGLCRIKRGQSTAGREDLQTAAVLEPNRSLLRSYLGKAFMNTGDSHHAGQELDLARRLDPQDPTPWLYEALLDYQENRMGDSVEELERSVGLSGNRQVYRSKLLLDQDRAASSVSLAKVYQGAGLDQVSVNEARHAVEYDYANYSAHLFLADSLNALRDPTRFNLRYETAWFNELLLANLLAPVGARTISQNISQQEYSRLLEVDRLGLDTTSEYRSDGQFHELTSQYGAKGGTSYSLDLDYQHNDGIRPNNDLSRIEWYSQIKQQLGPKDAVLLFAKYQEYHSGDNFQYYDPRNASPYFRFDEYQTPLLVGAWHHEWAPGIHTLLLGGRLDNEQRITDRNVQSIVINTNAAGTPQFDGHEDFDNLAYRGRFDIYTSELNQIFQGERQSLVLGGRFQFGRFETQDTLGGAQGNAAFFATPPAKADLSENFHRLSLYAYYTWEMLPHFYLTPGVTYDRMVYPDNFRFVPITSGTTRQERVSPKLGLVWSPVPEVTFRAAYARALGGASFDESFTLEPTEVAGFNQAFRSIISESEVGSVAGARYEVIGAALDLKLRSKTFITLEGQYLGSDVNETIGVFYFDGSNPAANSPPPVLPGGTPEQLKYKEPSVSATFNQLVGQEWSTGLQYRYTHSELTWFYPSIPATQAGLSDPPLNRTESSGLHEVNGYLLFAHPCGFYARAEAQWYMQDNKGYTPARPGKEFVQVNLLAGYRFWHRRAELSFGVLNVGGSDYQLSPLNVYNELPRSRVYVGRVRLNF
jgi:outer membrane receptor protein involved in Fe transport/Flp pilus assembly protein TadD